MFAFALWDEAEQRAVLRARPLRHQAVLLRRRSTTSSTSPPRRRRCCRSCRRSRPTSRASRTTSPSSSASPARRCSRASASCCPATACAVRNGAGRDRALLGGLLRPRLRPHARRTSRSASRSCCAESVRLHLRSDVPVGAYLSGGLDSSIVASLAAAARRRRDDGVHRQFPEDARYDESALRARARRRARPRPARGRHRRRRLPRARSSASSTTSTTRSPARARSRSTWSRRLAARAPQGRPRRPGRRRDLRRLRALPDRLLRAVHQGRDRRHDAQRQLRRHLRVDHPEPRRAARTTSRCCRSSGARAVRGPRRALLPADQPRAATSATRSTATRSATTRRSRPSRTIFNGDNVGHESYFDKMTHFDFKTLLPALLQVEDRVEHGARPRVARAAARPPRWSSWRRRCPADVSSRTAR